MLKRLLVGLIVVVSGCQQWQSVQTIESSGADSSLFWVPAPVPPPPQLYLPVKDDILMKDYFPYMDNLVAKLDTFRDRRINEYILVHANPWILDTLRQTDYYIRKQNGKFQYNQAEEIILHKGDSLLIPDSILAATLAKKLATTQIDVNIPEFTLRLLQAEDTLLITQVRVGQNREKYLELVKRKVDLRTPVGKGEIIRIARIPYYLNPETGKRYDSTKRDDNRYTKMPIIPWLEPSINGIRYGTLIHPTTNPKSLGKASSNGCVGTTEADGWIIYYYSPIGTRVNFRYDLQTVSATGDTVRLRNIYSRKK